MVNIYDENDLRAYAAANGPLMTLKGNIAPCGITVDLTTVPGDMIGMRGYVRRYPDLETLTRDLLSGKVHDGDALFLLEIGRCAEPQLGALERAVAAAGWKHLILVLSCRPERKIAGAANFWYSSPEDAARNHATVLREGDRMEYDLTAELFGVDLIECLDHRLSDRAGEPFYYEKLDNDIWVIGEEFTRMFLVLGSERALLIDGGFGYGDLAAAVRKITPLPYDVALTHGHFDHAGGIGFFREPCKVYLHPADNQWVEMRQGKEILSRLTPLGDGHVFDLGGRTIRTISLPGHSKGSVVFLDQERHLLFAGDSLLCGPYFLLNGEPDVRQLREGLTRLLDPALAIETFYPAHREMCPMTAEDVRGAVALLDGILDHTVKGVRTWIAPNDGTHFKTYRLGGFSAYSL